MEIKYSPSYNRKNTLYIAIHNTGGLGADYFASTQHLTAESVNLAHKDRFNMLSSLGWWGGYNFFIDKDGKITQFRGIGEETAAQKGYNFGGVAISVCLAGNFSRGVDRPTHLQIAAVKNLILSLPPAKIVPHRFLQLSTECYGSGLTDSYFNDIIVEELQKKISLLQQILVLMQRIKNLGSSLRLSAVKTQCDTTDCIG